MNTAPRASVVIPTWNGYELLVAALTSLETQTWREFETIVVDNGSTDGTAERVPAGFPDVRVVRLPDNRGFAAAVNEGIRAAAGDIIVLMNNDTEAAPDWLGELVGALERNPDVAACASKMMNFSERARIDSAGIQFGLFASDIGRGEMDGPRYSREVDVFGACAGAAAYTRSALDDVGHFDESYFAYFEDVDLSARLQLAGYRCLYVPSAIIFHHGSATSSRMADRRFYLLMRNALIVFLRYVPPRRLLWSPLVFMLPFARAIAERKSPILAVRAIRDALAGMGSVIATRRKWSRERRVGARVFRSRFVHPLSFSKRLQVLAGKTNAQGTENARS